MGVPAARLWLLLSCFCLFRVESAVEFMQVQRQGEKRVLTGGVHLGMGECLGDQVWAAWREREERGGVRKGRPVKGKQVLRQPCWEPRWL